MMIEKQRRKISLLKSQVGGVHKRLGKELTPESVQQPPNMKSYRRSWKKQGIIETSEIAEGFDDFIKRDGKCTVKDSTICNLLRKRQAKDNMAAKILQLRSENNSLNKQVDQRNERLKSLFYEAEHLRKQLKEAVSARNSALCQVRECDRLFEKLEAMEPLIVKAGIIKEHDVRSTCEDFPSDNACKPSGLDTRDRPKAGVIPDETSTINADELQINCMKASRKQAFKKWAMILSKMHAALLVFVSKVHSTSQMESSLKLEKDALNSLVLKLQHEVLADHDSESLHNMMEMEEQIQLGKDIEIHTGNLKVDRELVHKIIVAIRAQKRKLSVTTGRIEDLKKERISSEASIFSKQKKLSELEKKFERICTERDMLSAHISSMHSLLACSDRFSVSLGQRTDENHDVPNTTIHTIDDGMSSLSVQLSHSTEFETAIKNLQNILSERQEMKINITRADAENKKLSQDLNDLHDVIKLVGITDIQNLGMHDSLVSQLKNYKARKDELELFYEDSVSWHRSITTNLLILQSILTEESDYDDKKLLGLDYARGRSSEKSLLQESFKKVVSCIPDMVLKVNLWSIDHREFESKLQKAEIKMKEAENEVLKQSEVVSVLVGTKEELNEARNILNDIYKSLATDRIDAVEIKPLASAVQEQVHRVITYNENISRDNAESKRRVEILSGKILDAQKASVHALHIIDNLKQDMSRDAQESIEIGACKLHQKEKHESTSIISSAEGRNGDLAPSLNDLLDHLLSSLEEVQMLRKSEKLSIMNEALKLQQELDAAKEQLQKHAQNSINASNEKMQALSSEIDSLKSEKQSLQSEITASSARIMELERSLESLSSEIDSIKSEKQSLQSELAASSACIKDLEHSLRDLKNGSNTEVMALQDEKQHLIAEVKKLTMQNQEQLSLYEQSKKDMTNTVEALKQEVSNLKTQHSGTKDSADELRRKIEEGKIIHEQALKELENKKQSLDRECTKLQQEISHLIVESDLLNTKLKEKDSVIENMKKSSLFQADTFKLELAKASQQQAGTVDEISKLQSALEERERTASEAASQLLECSKRLETLAKERSEMQQIRLNLENQLKQLQKTISENETMYKSKLKNLTTEILRLGGFDDNDENERSRRQAAAERVKDYLAKTLLSDSVLRLETKGKDSTPNPLRKLAVFQVDLLVNTKAHKQLEVSGINGGLTQAAIHYFTISQQSGHITFENGNPPGSQSSNMLSELMLLSTNEAPIYETKAGDILGLSVKVKGVNDKNAREILYNTSVIRTDEVMEAIKGQPIDNFSLWPDLVSSWRWERSPSKNWVLVCIKWRFLFKNIFPELSEALQVISIKQGV
ncbi:hypothetical protein KP509_1Z130800 [Ceratopteris richardii]|nr:hypothetical protein KP509_1Z130800 [Ceratopteris richardii]